MCVCQTWVKELQLCVSDAWNCLHRHRYRWGKQEHSHSLLTSDSDHDMWPSKYFKGTAQRQGGCSTLGCGLHSCRVLVYTCDSDTWQSTNLKGKHYSDTAFPIMHLRGSFQNLLLWMSRRPRGDLDKTWPLTEWRQTEWTDRLQGRGRRRQTNHRTDRRRRTSSEHSLNHTVFSHLNDVFSLVPGP